MGRRTQTTKTHTSRRPSRRDSTQHGAAVEDAPAPKVMPAAAASNNKHVDPGIEVKVSTADLALKPLAPASLDAKATRAPALPIRNAEDLLADKTLKLPPELVQGILHKGTRGVLAGASKSGKSWALLDLAMSVATGKRWLKWDTTQGRVLYLNYEILEAGFADRVRMVKAAKVQDFGELDFSDFDIATLRGASFRPLQDIIEGLLGEPDEKKYALLVIDPLYRALGAGQERNPAAIERLAALLEELAKHKGTAVLLAHHYPKGKQDDKPLLDRFAGSGNLTRDLDTAIGLSDYGEKHCLRMEFSFRNFPDQSSLILERQPPRFIVRDDVPVAALNGQEDAEKEVRSKGLLDLLEGDGLTTSEWEKSALTECKIPRATFYREKKKLVASGKAHQDAHTKRWKRITAPV